MGLFISVVQALAADAVVVAAAVAAISGVGMSSVAVVGVVIAAEDVIPTVHIYYISSRPSH